MNNDYTSFQTYFKDKKDLIKWFNIAKPILNSEEFKIRKYFKHHEQHSIYDHSVLVSIKSFLLAKKFNANIFECTVAGLLHDFYTRAWQYSNELELLDEKYRTKFINKEKIPFLKKHAFSHPYVAASNAISYYPDYVNDKIIRAIETHMFPLSIFTKHKIPKGKVGWIVTLADKLITFKDLPNIKNVPKYLGYRKGSIRFGLYLHTLHSIFSSFIDKL